MLVIGAALSVFFLQALISNRTFFARDTLRMHGPIREYSARRLAQGELPLWWSHEALGTPFLAQGVTAVLHPVALLVSPLSPAAAIKVMTLLAYVGGALGAFALARRLQLSRTASVVSALGYVFSGYLVSISDNWTFLAGACALPGLLCSVDLTARRSHWFFAPVALLLASSVLAGDYQAAYLGTLAGMAWVLARAHGPGGRRAGAFSIAAAAVAAGLLCSIQLAGSWELLGQTQRGLGLDSSHAMRWSLHPLRLIELVLGQVVPLHGAYNYSGLLLGDPFRGVWSAGVHLGAVLTPLAFSAIAFHGCRRRPTIFLAGFAAIALLLALGTYGGLYPLAWKLIPLWSTFRFPEKLLPFVVLPVSLLAGHALDQLAGARTAAWWLAATALLAALILTVAGFFPTWSAATLVAVTSNQPGSEHLAAAADLVRQMRSSSAWALVSTGLAAAVAFGWARDDPTRARRLLGLIAVGELALANHDLYFLTPAESYALEPPFVEALAGRANAGHDRLLTAIGDESLAVTDPALSPREGLSLWEKVTLSPDFNTPYGIDNINPYLPGHLESLARLRRESLRWDLLVGVFSTRFLVVRLSAWLRTPLPPPARLLSEMRRLDLALVETPDAAPRAFLACAEVVDSAEAAAARIAEPDFPRGRHALVIRSGAGPLPECAASTGDPPGTATIESYGQEQVEITVEATTSALLVLNDADYPGWKATLDGQPVSIRRVNIAVRGVLVPAGSHRVTFAYQPSWLIPSAVVSALSALALAIALAAGCRSPRAGAACVPSENEVAG